MKILKNIFLGLSFLGMLILASCGSETTTSTTATENANKTAEKAPNSVASKNNTTKNTATANKKTATTGGKVNWVSIEEAEKLSQTEKRKVMIDLYTSWCGWCKKMDKSTFQHPAIADYLNDNFYAVKFDAETKSKVKFKDQEYAFVQAGRRGYNQLAHNFASGRMSYPTISFLDENLEVIKAFPGFKQPEQFDPLLHFIKEDHYKSKTLIQFAKNYKSEL